ncbi:MAG: MaoC/PaaZ C-terminal domain-containing protein [Pseudomonadota bacterium]
MPLNKEFTKMPAMLPLLAKAAISRGSGAKELPALTRSIRDVGIHAQHLKAYNAVCGFNNTAIIPPTYLFICAQPLFMDIMLDKTFPFKVLGLVHVRNQITQHRPVRCSERYDVDCALQNLQAVDKGYEFDIVCDVSVSGEVVWSCVMTTIVRTKSSGSGTKEKKAIEAMDWSDWTTQPFKAPADIGRRYAKISGDYNPIHLYPLTAKLLGFPKAIAHGMWMKAKLLSMLPEGYDGKHNVVIDVAFKLPNLLPATLDLHTREVDGVHGAWLRTRKGDKPIVQMSVTQKG